jgi:thiol:disulfide interchange protein DsbD
MHFLRLVGLWLTVLLAPLAASARATQFGAQAPKAKLEFFARAEGRDVRAVARIKISSGWHLYGRELGNPTAVGLPSVLTLEGDAVAWGEPRWPAPEIEKQDFGSDGNPTEVNIYHGTVLVYVRGILAEGADLASVGARLEGQTCESGGVCVLYKDKATVTVGGPDTVFAAFPADLSGPSEGADAAAEDDDEEEANDEDDEGPLPFEPYEDPEAHARVELYTRKVDGEARAVIRIDIDPTWHLFHEELGPEDALAVPTVVKLGGDGIVWGEVLWPEPHKGEQAYGANGEPTWAWQHEGTIVLYARGTLEPGADVAKANVDITGQTCDPQVCVQFSAAVESLGAGADSLFESFPAAGAKPASVAAGEEAPAPEESGLMEFLGLAVFWGVFSLLMPCTYPMIPITISFFTKQASQQKGKRITLSALYGLGIVLMFILIGLLVGAPIIQFATHPTTNLVIGAFFVVFALSLLGLFNLEPPAFLMNMAGQARSSGGYLGVFLMGATLVITSFTCTAPFVGSLLSVGASSGDWQRIVLGMGTFGLTMAIPFVALSLVPGKLSAMPRAGEWMNTLKITLGFVEFAAALKFFSNADLALKWEILPRELFLALWFGVFLVTAIYLLGLIRYHGESGEIGGGRLLAGMLFFCFAIYCGFGALGNKLDSIVTAIAPPYSTPRVAGFETSGGDVAKADKREHEIVKDDYEAALKLAGDQRKLVLVNFTGYL